MKRDDKGFTLLEVLIAVIVLAIVIVPMLHSFVSSYNVNAKSREIMRATTLAQNEMEIFEKEKLEVLVEDANQADDAKKYGYDGVALESSTTTDSATGEETEHVAYTFTKKGVINDGSDKDMFDVVVKLDPESASTSALYYTQNTQGLLSMNTLSFLDSGAYVQKVRNNVNMTGDDEDVYDIYVGRQNTPTHNAEKFKKDLKRTIAVTIEQEDQGSFMATVVKVNYEYVCSYGLVPDDKRNYSAGEQVIFNNAQTLDEEGNPIELQSVYLFYAPRYDTDLPADKENIVIYNEKKLPVNVYIIRQNIWDESGNTLGVYMDSSGVVHYSDKLSTYTANIEIHEYLDGDGKTYGSYFTNLNLDTSNASTRGTTKITLKDISSGTEYNSDTNFATVTEKLKFRSLDAKEKKDRIYTMDVAVYRHGANPNMDDPLVRLTGTKIEQ